MNASDRPVLPWRIVAAGFLHFALPVYLFIGLACCAVALLGGLTASGLAARALPYSLWFAVTYAALATLGTAGAAMLDPLLRRRRRRRARSDPAASERQSRRDLATALADGRARLDRDAVSVLDALASIEWRHETPAYQSASADLAAVVRTSIAALGTATPQRRPAFAAVTTAALSRIGARLRDLHEERGRLDEGDLHTVARYIDSRYPPADCTGDSAG